jgi:inorganic pyrophosphatase
MNRNHKQSPALRLIAFSTLLFLLAASCVKQNHLNEITIDETVISASDFLRGFPAMYDEQYVNIVIEIPAGSNQKWEVDKVTGHLEWERVGPDSLRVVRYLPYPANYGMIPRTLLPLETGGDGDPIDIFLLGESKSRGSVTPARIIGMIQMVDRGETDDKLIAVDPNSWFASVRSVEDLEMQYPGVMTILKTFMANYKGPGFVEILGVDDVDVAMEVFRQSMIDFEHSIR